MAVATKGAYLRQEHRARSTGAVVGIYDTCHPDNVFDPAGGRWVTVCEKHAAVCNHQTLALARSFAAAPEDWCIPCQEELDAKLAAQP